MYVTLVRDCLSLLFCGVLFGFVMVSCWAALEEWTDNSSAVFLPVATRIAVALRQRNGGIAHTHTRLVHYASCWGGIHTAVGMCKDCESCGGGLKVWNLKALATKEPLLLAAVLWPFQSGSWDTDPAKPIGSRQEFGTT